MILQIFFYLLLIFLFHFTFRQFRKLLRRQFQDPVRRKKIRNNVRIGTAIYVVYIALVSESGLLLPLEGIPRIPLLLVFPAFALWGYIVFSDKYEYLKQYVPVHLPVVFQIFRVAVELLLWGAFMEGLIPKAATFEGYNFEIIVACSAPILAYLVWNKNVLPEKVMILWNVLGLISLAIIVGIFISGAYMPELFENDIPLATDFVQFPYMLIPGLFMPFAVFLHVFSIRQLRQRN